MKFNEAQIALAENESLEEFKQKLRKMDYMLKWKPIEIFIEKENDFIPLIQLSQLSKRATNFLLIIEQSPKEVVLQKSLMLQRNRKKKSAFLVTPTE